jgi:hypothetical protein
MNHALKNSLKGWGRRDGGGELLGTGELRRLLPTKYVTFCMRLLICK